MKARKQRKKRLFSSGWGLLFFAVIVLTGTFWYGLVSSPDTIRITRGEEKSLYTEGIFQISREDVARASRSEQSSRTEIETTINSGGHTSSVATLRLLGIIPVKTVTLEIWEEKYVQVSGQIIGLDLYTDGILVLGMGKIQTATGEVDSPAKGHLFTGDRIRCINGKEVNSVEEVEMLLKVTKANTVELLLERGNKEKRVIVPTVIAEDGTCKLGIWIRDRARGIGTMTFFDPETGSFGAVGHGIADVDTGEILPVKDGTVTAAAIHGITKGEKGVPGEIEASLTRQVIGTVKCNTDIGVYGQGNAGGIHGKAYPLGFQSSVKNGKAFIMTELIAGKSEMYEVKITKTTGGLSGEKGLLVQVVDEKLLETTGGIIQGMSGSPIIQDGKLIGAVTHVLVNDPTRGYGIFIENMLEAAG